MKEITAKTLLGRVKQPDTWFGLRYNMNLYRGCQHQCIYCDSRSECYRIDDFAEVAVKANALELLPRELAAKRVKGAVGFGSMHDPYMPVEADIDLTGRALDILAQHRFPAHLITKSALVERDIERLLRLPRAAVSFTVTTADDDLASKLEPGASLPSERFRAMKRLADAGVLAGTVMMPVLPFIEDNVENVAAIVEATRAAGGGYIIPAFGMTLRDRQRAWYYEKLDRLFPGLRGKYERTYGDRYSCACPDARELEREFSRLAGDAGLETRMPGSNPDPVQADLFEEPATGHGKRR